MHETTRGGRNGYPIDPFILSMLPSRRGLWHEDGPAIRRALRWGRRKEQLLRWVRVHMLLVLTRRERECVELYYFRGLCLREAGAASSTHPSSVHRALKRAIRKLRKAAQEDTSWR